MATLLVFLALWASGCTVYQTQMPTVPRTEAEAASFRIRPLKGVDSANGRIATFVNRDPGTVRQGLIFSGYQSRRNLIQFGPDGSPGLTEDYIGFFYLDPAFGQSYPRHQDVGPFVPGNTYTALVMTTTVLTGRVLGIEVVVFTMPDRPYQYRFAGRDVNMVVELPGVCYPNSNNDLHLEWNASWAIREAIHRMMYGN